MGQRTSKLDLKYCITYGDPQAPVHVTEFFSFQCPRCIGLFKSDFENIKKDFIDTGKIHFQFHPIPQDLPTAQALICFENLTESEKQVFLEVVFEEAIYSDPDFTTQLMMAAMNAFKKPIPQLANREFVQNHKVFEEIFYFIKQEKILAVPTIEINGQILANEIPNYQFIQSLVDE